MLLLVLILWKYWQSLGKNPNIICSSEDFVRADLVVKQRPLVLKVQNWVATKLKSNIYKLSAWEQWHSNFKRVRNHILASYQGLFLHPDWSVQVWNLKVQHINVRRSKHGFHFYILVHVKLNLLAGHGEETSEEILPQLWTGFLFTLQLLGINIWRDGRGDAGAAQSDEAGWVGVKSTTIGVGTFWEADHRHWHCHAEVLYF